MTLNFERPWGFGAKSLARSIAEKAARTLAIVLLPLAISAAADAGPRELQCTAKNASTAPAYVLVTVVSIKTGERFRSTVESTDLQAALAAEHQIPEEGRSRAYYDAVFRLIDQHPDLVFEFAYDPAIDRLRLRYTDPMVSEVRQVLEGLSDEKILAGFGPGGPLHRLYEREEGFWMWQPAVAHVLLERGFFAGRGDYVPTLFVSRSASCFLNS